MYKISELTGNIYFNGVVVPQDDTNTMWQAYWLHKQDGGEIIFVEATLEEIEEANKPIVPQSISQMKLRKQLILSGISIASIDALIQSLPQPNRDLIYTMWEYAVVFDRHNPELNAMAGMLGVTQQQLDEIFINGNLL